MTDDPVFLYVDDDHPSRIVLQTLLVRALGFSEVFLFEDSDHFIEQLEQLPKKPTLIFLDIHMQPFDGVELLHQLRAHQKYQAIPVIALTASVMNEEINRLKAEGFNGGISKPISQRTFPELLQMILAGEEVWHIK
jgi:CheY-like chemotaxis protein